MRPFEPAPVRAPAAPPPPNGEHRWPQLPDPAPPAAPGADVEAALRAWEHRRRVDREQAAL
ncbi:MAG: hypothetical protein ACXVFK_07500 [Solirubrobacteraceae bacterium]